MKKEGFLFTFLCLIFLSGCQSAQYVYPTETAVPTETTVLSAPPPIESRSKKYPPGQYLVGVDIPAGEYKLICEDNDYPGYYCVSKTALAKVGEIIANNNFHNMAYVEIEMGNISNYPIVTRRILSSSKRSLFY